MVRRVVILLVGLVVAAACSSTGLEVPSCARGATSCALACVDLREDRANCGSCERACTVGQVCDRGACAADCGGGTIRCQDTCVDPRIDPRNCGDCGVACSQGQACVQGKCSSTCADPQSLCFNNKGPFCASARSDNNNCGQCGRQCPYWKVCADGVCSGTCASDQKACIGTNGPFCASTESDNLNCGGCGTGGPIFSCGILTKCAAGVCQSTCGADQVACGNECRTLKSDPNHCGACYNSCGKGGVCVASQCTCLDGGMTSCGMQGCVDLNNDANNCGSCGAVCAGRCSRGRCVLTLASNLDVIYSLAADGTYVYVSQGSAPLIARIPVGGGAPFDLAAGYAWQGFPAMLRTDGINVYFLDSAYLSTTLCSVPVGGGVVTVLGTIPDRTPIMAMDSVNAYTRGPNGIYSVPLAGGSATKIAPSDGVTTTTSTIASDGKNVVWMQYYPSYKLLSVPVGGGAVSTIAVSQLGINAVESNADGYIYFMSTNLQRIHSDGQNYTAFFSYPLGRLASYNKNLYIGEAYNSRAVWRFDPTLNNSPTQLVELGYYGLNAIAVDSKNVYWTDTNRSLFSAPN